MAHFMDEAGLEELLNLLLDDVLALQRLSVHLLSDGPCIRVYGQVVLNHLPRDPGNIRRLLGEHISVCPEEGDEHEFLFGVKRPTHLDGPGSVYAQRDLLDRDNVAGHDPGPRLSVFLLLRNVRWLIGDCRGVHQLYTPHGTLHVDGHCDEAL